jgi:3-oxoacyl-[acyl-carrier protein] reductase
MRLKGKVALVTGGARGIGREIALMFAREGSDMAICDVNAETLASIQKELEALNVQVIVGVVDVMNAVQADEFVQKTLDKYKKIDILINNAGITRDGLLVRMSESDWDLVLAVNLKGAFNFTKAVSKIMMKQRDGRIVNMASIIGIMGNAGQANYAASKGGLIAFTKSVAKELASRNIRANAIAPGFIQTDMTAKLSDQVKGEMLKFVPLGRFGTVQDIANLALFLAGDESSYITGQAIQIDGGMVM